MSIVDSILSQYGFEWKLNPYRIVKNNTIIQSGPAFDITEKTLKRQYNAYLRRAKSQFGTGIPSQK